jgi:hypothetical protein
LENNDPCALWSQCDEHVDHLFIGCALSRSILFRVLNKVSWHTLAPIRQEPLVSWWITTRKRVAKRRRKAFGSLVLLVVRCLWLERSNRVFSRQASIAEQLVHGVWLSCDSECVQS